MFSRSTMWFICISMALVIANVYSTPDSIAASGASPSTQQHTSPALNPPQQTAADCTAPPPNATAVSVLQSLSDEEKNSRLTEAARKGEVQDVWTLLAAGADVAARDVLLTTPLHWAATKGHREVVSCLLQAGAQVNATDAYRATPLHDAAWHGHADVVSQLLAASADVGATDFLGWTPLHNAARQGHEEAVRVLLAAEADKAAATDSANIPLDVARLNEQHSLADLLT